MQILHKMLIAPVIAILFLLACGAVSYTVILRQSGAMQVLHDGALRNVAGTSAATQAVSDIHATLYRVFTADTSDDIATTITANLQKRLGTIAAELAQRNAQGRADAEEANILEALVPRIGHYSKRIGEVMQLRASDRAAAVTPMLGAESDYQSVVKLFGMLIELEQARARKQHEATRAQTDRALLVLLVLTIAAAAASTAIAVLISTRVVRPLRRAIGSAETIAQGDLTADVQVAGRDETGQLLRSLAVMTENLRAIATEVAQNARSVSEGSAQIAQGNLDLSQRTEEQASTLEETASSLQELTATVARNAQHAQEASTLARGASDLAVRGGNAMDGVVSTMNDITTASRQISDITAVIDSIAFQTNILALNAAVEAARAGEQGRGFAVVAAEVRALAHRSSNAAKEIKALIGNSVGKVDTGVNQVAAAGGTIREIVAAVQRVSDLVAEIAGASREQSAGIAQVNTAVVQMEQVVQHNASLVEEASAATESMNARAAALVKVVSQFKLRADAPRENRREEPAPEPAGYLESSWPRLGTV